MNKESGTGDEDVRTKLEQIWQTILGVESVKSYQQALIRTHVPKCGDRWS